MCSCDEQNKPGSHVLSFSGACILWICDSSGPVPFGLLLGTGKPHLHPIAGALLISAYGTAQESSFFAHSHHIGHTHHTHTHAITPHHINLFILQSIITPACSSLCAGVPRCKGVHPQHFLRARIGRVDCDHAPKWQQLQLWRASFRLQVHGNDTLM